MLTQSVCVSVYVCVSLYNGWILSTRGTFASNWAQRGCSVHALGQHLHEVNQRGPKVIVTTFPCQSGRYFDKTTVNALLREAGLHITSGELQHPLRHHQFIWRCKFALRRLIIIDYHQISKFKSSLMLDVKRCASRLYWLRGERAGKLRYLKLGAGPLSIDRINNIESFTVLSR